MRRLGASSSQSWWRRNDVVGRPLGPTLPRRAHLGRDRRDRRHLARQCHHPHEPRKERIATRIHAPRKFPGDSPMSITLEELRNEWSHHSRRLAERLRLSAHLLRDDWIERQRERVWKLGPFGSFSMAVWIATAVLLGLFLGKPANQPGLF